MRVMVIVKATKESEAGVMPSAQLLADMGAFNQALMDAGVFVDAAGLKDSRKGARVAFAGKDRTAKRGAVPEYRRGRRGLLDLESEGPRRGDRLGQALP
jgi:hypothetical protein